MEKYAIGVDIGGTKCSVVLGEGHIPDNSLKGFIIDKICFPTEAAKGPAFTIRNIMDAVHEIMRRTAGSQEGYHYESSESVWMERYPYCKADGRGIPYQDPAPE